MVIRSAIREVIRTHQASENPLVRYGVGASRWAHRLVRSWASADYRAVMRAKVFSSRRLHQTTTLTWMDRYPGVFAACRDHLGDRPGLNVLSFGCSTGDEALTLRRYFPQATIVGAEINRRCLAACRRQIVDDRTSFILSEPATIGRHGPYDAIFCMAVLQRTPHLVENDATVSLERIYPFEKFDRQVRQLDGWLKTGGLLVVHHSQYRFADASVSGRYRALEAKGQEIDRNVKFDRHSRRLALEYSVQMIFVKLGDESPASR